MEFTLAHWGKEETNSKDVIEHLMNKKNITLQPCK